MPLEDNDFPEVPSDFAGEGATSPGPDLEEDIIPSQPTEPQRASDAQPDGESEVQEPLPEFDARVRDAFEGLLYLGRLSKKVKFAGHEFLIHTLTVDEVLEVGLLHKDYADSLADLKAYQSLVVAACVSSVDRRPMPGPISSDPNDTGLRNRFDQVRLWYPPVTDAIYEEYRVLEDTVARVIAEMGKVSGETASVRTLNGASV